MSQKDIKTLNRMCLSGLSKRTRFMAPQKKNSLGWARDQRNRSFGLSAMMGSCYKWDWIVLTGCVLAAQKIKIAKLKLWARCWRTLVEFMQLIRHHLLRMHAYLWLRTERYLPPRKCTKITTRQMDKDLTLTHSTCTQLRGLCKCYGSLFPSKLLEGLDLSEISTKHWMMGKTLVYSWHLLSDLVWDLCFRAEHKNPWSG